MGHISPQLGKAGDLMCTVRWAEPSAGPVPESADIAPTVVTIGVAQALLGTKRRVETTDGTVSLIVPPGTSSGEVLYGELKETTSPSYPVKIEIKVPRELNDESRALIARFAELNSEQD